jgi:hypothetical protein
MSTSSNDEKKSDPRRPYQRPALKRYGDLAQLTQQKGGRGQDADGAIANNNKTL